MQSINFWQSACSLACAHATSAAAHARRHRTCFADVDDFEADVFPLSVAVGPDD